MGDAQKKKEDEEVKKKQDEELKKQQAKNSKMQSTCSELAKKRMKPKRSNFSPWWRQFQRAAAHTCMYCTPDYMYMCLTTFMLYMYVLHHVHVCTTYTTSSIHV